MNVNIPLDQAERLVEDLQTLLNANPFPGRKERKDTRRLSRDVISHFPATQILDS